MYGRFLTVRSERAYPKPVFPEVTGSRHCAVAGFLGTPECEHREIVDVADSSSAAISVKLSGNEVSSSALQYIICIVARHS